MYRVVYSFNNLLMEDFREMGKKFLDFINFNVSDIFGLVLDIWFGN